MSYYGQNMVNVIPFNSAVHLHGEDIKSLSEDIKEVMQFLRSTWPNANSTPKLNMVEDHIVPFVTRWRRVGDFMENKVENPSIKA